MASASSPKNEGPRYSLGQARTSRAVELRCSNRCVVDTAAPAAAAPANPLPDDVSRLVPGCAQGCFLSFLAFNYGTGVHGQVPSLGWLCSTPGDSEYTVGEGAVQCLAAEKSFGSCSQEEASQHPRNDEERKHGFIVAFSNTHRQCDCQDMVDDEEELNLEDEEKLNPDDDEELNPDDDEELKLDDDDELNPDDDELNLDAVVGLEHADLCI
ncbi:hypothetical protein OCS_06146 [Ophiocordyceps sinensis CO18]|uniref:Uncharacterized protein n=1 Tax=Ophiocordyceps sinensis (strain Co18 / CGMCC 3.14243) TaxID=911162 RepID=T4ZYD7_OPHSC|nr:hypothetical protein OCS_06146 [Ophiocordyceps sinensis CO18]